MNILGIDYGKKRIGLAWAQGGLDVVLPFGKLETGNLKLELITLIDEEKIDTVVIGMPFGLDGKENENTERVHAFADDLQKHISIPIEFVDERFTSKEADNTPGDITRDEKAAMIILQTYLDKNHT